MAVVTSDSSREPELDLNAYLVSGMGFSESISMGASTFPFVSSSSKVVAVVALPTTISLDRNSSVEELELATNSVFRDCVTVVEVGVWETV